MPITLFQNVVLVNEGVAAPGELLVDGADIAAVGPTVDVTGVRVDRVVDGRGHWLMPGCIDDQVHFREPGLTHKADLTTESAAAAAGGITSFMEMPNTVPNTLTLELLEEKYARAAEVSPVNYSFYLGGSNDNLHEIARMDPSRICGVKVFMGSSTGNMLVDSREALCGIFSEAPTLVAVHCEDEATVRAAAAAAKASSSGCTN
jgi:dihydroorotase